jgi:hypothetical protein
MRTRIYRSAAIVLMLLISAASALAAKVYLKNETVIEGEILSFDPKSVTIQEPGVGRSTILRVNILKIDPPLAEPAAGPPAARSGIQLGIALSGGIGKIGGSDLNKMIRDYNTFYADINAIKADNAYQVDWKEMKELLDLRAEIVARFGRYFGVGLGAEYLTSTRTGTVAYAYAFSARQNDQTTYMDYTITDQSSQSHEHTLTVIPISLSLYGFLPLGSRADIFVGAGPDYYLGTLDYHLSELETYDLIQKYYMNSGSDIDTFSSENKYDTRYHEKSTSRNVGVHLSGGLHVRLFSGFELFAEALYRWANLKDWQGDADMVQTYTSTSGYLSTGLTTTSDRMEGRDSGKLWYFEDYEPSYRTKYYGRMEISSDAPGEDIGMKNVRTAAIDLTGISATVGVKISFNLR